jgi:serine/threonine protein kinase
MEDDSTKNSTSNKQMMDASDETKNTTSYLFSQSHDEDDEVEQKEEPTEFQLLQIAHSIASAVADFHHVDSLGRPTMAHTDIKPDQWILVSSSSSSSRTGGAAAGGGDGDSNNETSTPSLVYQLVDFDRARFLTWDTVRQETCPFQVEKNGGPWRSPEEYNYGNQTEKGDIWSLGNMLYFLVSGGKPPFGDLDNSEAMELVKKGGHPTIDEHYKVHQKRIRMRGNTSLIVTDDDDDSLLFLDIMGKAMMSCFEFDPKKRPSAHQIVTILEQGLVTWASNNK